MAGGRDCFWIAGDLVALAKVDNGIEPSLASGTVDDSGFIDFSCLRLLAAAGLDHSNVSI
jgi:hypothetical protein